VTVEAALREQALSQETLYFSLSGYAFGFVDKTWFKIDCGTDARYLSWLQSLMPVAKCARYQDISMHFSRNSFIDLYEEMVMHVALCLQGLGHFDKISALMPEIHNAVDDVLKSILADVKLYFDDPNIKIRVDYLNQSLDKKRLELAKLCRAMVANKLNLSADDIAALTSKTFTALSASGFDYFRVDNREGMSTRILGTEKTAHDKKLGADEMALRSVIHMRWDGEQFSPYNETRVHARVPSLAVIEFQGKTAIEDVRLKLEQARTSLSSANPNYHGPMYYYLLTSLSGVYLDRFYNWQRLSASFILKGAHRYNVDKTHDNYVFVQNIPVNQHTALLSNDSDDEVIREATLMADMSLMRLFLHHASKFPSSISQDIIKTMTLLLGFYQVFLNNIDKRSSFSSDKKAEKVMLNFRAWMKGQLNHLRVDADFQTLVLYTLFKFFVTGAHREKAFGMLVQSLSLYLSPFALAGCKSANERYLSVAGRAALLKSMEGRTDAALSVMENKLIYGLRQFTSDDSISCEGIQWVVDVTFNHHYLQAMANISLEDQGAGAKVVASRSGTGVVSEYNTNVAESGYLTYLSQKYAGQMQAHKLDWTQAFPNQSPKTTEPHV